MSRIALCLNSSYLGFYAHAGFLASLDALGVKPVAVSGASAGALVAGFYAAGIAPERVVEIVLAGKLRRGFVELGAPWRSLATLSHLRGHTGALHGDRALALIAEHVGARRIEECNAPRLAISVTNLAASRSEVVTAGPLAEFILASGALPGMFAARSIGGGLYWDGGIANSLPFDPWLTDPEIDTILVHVVANQEELAACDAGASMNIAGAMNVSHQAICAELLRLKTELAAKHGKRLVFLRTLTPRPKIFSARRLGPQYVEAGRATVAANRALLDGLGGIQ